MVVWCGNLTIPYNGRFFHCFSIFEEVKLRRSLGRPSRSDFVQVDFIEQLVKDENLDERGYFIYHAVGTQDAVKSQSINMAEEMLSREIFTPEHYVFYQKDGGYHDFNAVQEYLYNALPLFFRDDLPENMLAEGQPYTTGTAISDVTGAPAFGDYGRLIFPVDTGYYSGRTLGDLRLMWYSEIDPDETVEIANYMKSHAQAGETIFYDIYTDEEKRLTPTRPILDCSFSKAIPAKRIALLCTLLMLLSLAACASSSSGTGGNAETDRTSHNVAESPSDFGQSAGSENESGESSQTLVDATETDAPVVYMTTDISPEGLMKAYEALGVELTGDNIAVKLSTGEPPASNYLDPDLILDLVEHVDGTIVECNTAYGGSRSKTAMHYQVAEDHGFTDLGKGFLIMDEDGESMILPVEGGQRLTENYVGAHFGDFDGFLVLSHFKGHMIAGFGGAIKNISIGIGSQEGKNLIHTAGRSHTSWFGGEQDAFLESMADAGKSVVDALDGNILSCISFVHGGRRQEQV